MSLKTYGSLFAGVGGIDIGFDSVGLECLFQVEVDQNCVQTLEYHWPKVHREYDITNVSGYNLPGVDIISFGSPCQDLSFAGKRVGLNGDKSVLFYEAVRIIKEMREKTNGQYPKWTLWENVPGALSSNGGADFGQVLWEMDEAGACFSEWAVLDAKYFGVPQRRRRLFLLSCFDSTIASRCGEKILPIQESSRGYSKKSFEKRKKYSSSVTKVFDENSKTINSNIYFSHTQGLDIQASEQYTPTLRRMGGGAAVLQHTKDGYIARKLTPIECERLMGWPDNHTLYRKDGKTNPDTIRYKMCGNGVASPVVQWIAKKIITI